MIPGPPALVTIATRSPLGTGCLVSSAATLKSSWSVSVRITPAWSNNASTVTSEADSSAPVCDEVARAPAADRPLLTARIGFLRAIRGASRENLRGLPNDSRYSSATSVLGSCSQNWRKSLPDRSALFPTETNDDRPTPSRPAASMIAMPSPPLCDRKPTFPGIAGCGANVALRRTSGCVLMSPRQLGPISLIPDVRQISTSSRWRSAPSSPASANPAEMTSSERTPTPAHSRATPTTPAAGTTTTPRSTVPGTSAIE